MLICNSCNRNYIHRSLVLLCFIGCLILPTGVSIAAVISYDAPTQTITIESGTAYPQDIADAVNNPSVFDRTGTISVMTANLKVGNAAELIINGETVKLNCSEQIEFGITNNGSLVIENAHVTSVMENARGWINNVADNTQGYRFRAINSEFSFLGYIDHTLENLLDGRYGTFTHPIRCRGVTAEPLFFSGNHVHNCDLVLWVDSATNGQIVNNTFYDITAFRIGDYYPPGHKRVSMCNNFGAIEIYTGNDNLIFAHNRIYNVSRNDDEATGHILRVMGSQENLIIEKNEIYDCDGDEVVLLKHSAGTTVQDNYIHDITFKWSTLGCGVMVYKGMGQVGEIVRNNRIENCNYGVYLLYYTQEGYGSVIKDNVIINCNKSIDLLGVRDALFENNILINCPINFRERSATYREVYMTCHNNQFINNRIYLDGLTDTDNDDMPDWWEEEKGLNLNSPDDAGEDPDGNGLTNLQEYEQWFNYWPVMSETGIVSGTVTNTSGAPLQGAIVTNGEWLDISDETGRYALNNVPVGVYMVTASSTGYQSQSQGSIQVLGNQETEVDFKLGLSGGNISGTVKDPENNPIKEAVIKVDSYSVTTNSTGDFTITLSAGNYIVTALKSGYLSQSKTAAVIVGETITLDFVLAWIGSSGKVFISPSPYVEGKSSGEQISFGNLPEKSTIRIYTISGKLIKTIEHSDTADGGSEEWDISGIAGGIYMYTIISPEGKKTGKVSVIK